MILFFCIEIVLSGAVITVGRRDRDVPIARAELVTVDAEVVRQLEPVSIARKPHEDVDRLVANREPAPLLKTKGLVEGNRPLRVRDSVAGVDELDADLLELRYSGQRV